MPPAVILSLVEAILPYGIQAAAALVNLFASKNPPTAEQWAALISSTNVTAKDQMMATLIKHGVDPASQQGKDLLALVPA